MRGQRAGAVHWAVPAGAEFDPDPESSYDGRESYSGWNANYDPWGRLEEASHWRMADETDYRDALTEREADFDPTAYFGEEDLEAGMPVPRKRPLRVHAGVFDDLADPLAYVSPAMLREAFSGLREAPKPGRPRKRERPPFRTGDIRRWAREQGIHVASHGPIPNEVWEAWHAAVSEERDQAATRAKLRNAYRKRTPELDARRKAARERRQAKLLEQERQAAERLREYNERLERQKEAERRFHERQAERRAEQEARELQARLESMNDYERALYAKWGES